MADKKLVLDQRRGTEWQFTWKFLTLVEMKYFAQTEKLHPP